MAKFKPCTKIKYRKRIDAKIALANTYLKGKGRGSAAGKREESRIYYCPKCHAYHLTSMPLNRRET